MPDERTDDALIHAAAQRDIGAVAELYRRYAGRGLTMARQYGLPDPVTAVEEGFVAIYHSAHTFARSSLPAPVWTLGMLRQHCLLIRGRREAP